jgi:hypothetical protein
LHSSSRPRIRAGSRVVVPRAICAREITGVRSIPQVIGWRFHPAAKGRPPLWPPNSSISASRLRRRIEQLNKGPWELTCYALMTRVSTLGQSRHFDRGPAPSGLPRSTDIIRPARLVRLVPARDIPLEGSVHLSLYLQEASRDQMSAELLSRRKTVAALAATAACVLAGSSSANQEPSCHNAKVVLADRGDTGQVLIGQRSKPAAPPHVPPSRFLSLEAFGRRP